MRPPSIASAQYTPESPPSDSGELGRWMETELLKVASAIQLLALGHIDVTYVAPTKPRDGDIRYADGTRWNPNLGGRGFYFYNGAASTWVRMNGML